MALITATISGSSQQYLGKTTPTGTFNVRTSHTIMGRIKWTSTTPSEKYQPYAFVEGTNFSGSWVPNRNSGDPSTQVSAWRQSSGGTLNRVNYAGGFGNTTTWYHFALVYDASTQVITFYVDGVSQGTVSSLTTLPTNANGNIYAGIGKCKSADYAVFNRALSAGEVLSMATYRVPQVTSGLIAFYRMDTNSTGGTTSGPTLDTSGNSNTMTVQNSGGTALSYSTADNPPQAENPPIAVAGTSSSASTLTAALTVTKPAAGTQTSASTLAAWIRPRWGRRIEYQASAQSITIGGLSIPNSGPWTFMTWAKPITLANNSDEVSVFGTGPASDGPTLALRKISGTINTSLRVFASGTGTNPLLYEAANDGAWHHFAVTFDGATARAYVDGSLVATAAATLANTITRISWRGNTVGSNGEFAHTKVWTAQLSATEIANEAAYYTPYNQLSSLSGWWQLGWQNVTLDSSGNGRTLTDNTSTEAQNESPGVPMFLLSSTATSASTLTGTPSVSKPISATATSASTLTATLTVSLPVAATATSASTLTGSLGQNFAVASTATSASTLNATLFQTIPVASTATSASTLTGQLIQAQPVAATATSASTLTGNLGTAVPLTANASTSASTLTGSLIQSQPLASTATSASTLTATIGVNGIFAGTATSASTLTGDLGTTKPLTANAASSASTLTGSMVQVYAVTGTAQSASTLTGDVQAQLLVSGTSTSASTLTGALGVAYTVAGTATSASTLSADLQVLKPLASTATSASTLTGSLLSTNQLAGAAASASTLTGTVTNFALRQVAGTSFSASTLIGALSLTVSTSARGDCYTGGSATVFYGNGPPNIPRRREWPPRPR